MKKNTLCAFILTILGFTACEKEFNPNLTETSDDVVVEGYIEAGRNAPPPYVILTKSLPFFRELPSFNNVFINGAEVSVSNGKDSVQLTEFCWKSLPEAFKKQAAQVFNLNLDSIPKDFNFCVYIDQTMRIQAEIGKTYTLNVKTKEGKILSAVTTIPRAVKIDSADFVKPPGINNNDSLTQMRAYANDPKGNDYYRYFTSINGSSYIAGRTSVADDAFFEGINTRFNLSKSEPRNSSANFDTYGLWRRGDTVSIKFCTIDKAHFEFWQTLEFNANNSGPFSSYTRVKHNVKGGMGIWGGYNAAYFDAIVPKK
jgi:Domain of unknown function (DUF4249)